MPLGITEEASWTQAEITFDPGDVLIAYTDGITEAQNDNEEFYGEDRLVEVADPKTGNTAQELVAALEEDILVFSSTMPQLDDMTLMIIKKGD